MEEVLGIGTEVSISCGGGF